MKINKGSLVKSFAETTGISVNSATKFLNVFLERIAHHLKENGRVTIKGFGTFIRKVRKGRSYRHPVTRDLVAVPDKETVVFISSINLIDDVVGTVDDKGCCAAGHCPSHDIPATLVNP